MKRGQWNEMFRKYIRVSNLWYLSKISKILGICVIK